MPPVVHYTRTRKAPACGARVTRSTIVIGIMESVTCNNCRDAMGAARYIEPAGDDLKEFGWGRHAEGRYETVPVLGAAYVDLDAGFLTHTYDEETDRTLCKRVKTSNLGEGVDGPNDPPTCESCLKRDPRFNGTSPLLKPNRRPGYIVETNPDARAAAEIREAFYDKPVDSAFDFEWKWPKTLLEVGRSEAVQYTSDKWKKRGDYEDYKHVAEGPQRLYVKPGFLRDFSNSKHELSLDCEEVTLPARMPTAVAELAPILGIQFTPYKWRGNRLVVSDEDPFHVMIQRAYIGAAKLPGTNETFLVIYTRSELCAIITGDILGVEKDGIVG